MAVKNVTVQHFKEILKPSLEQRPIYLRKDIEEDGLSSSKNVAEKIAQHFPLIRISDFVVHKNLITHFSIEVGKTFLPMITLTFNDEFFRCRRTLTSKLDFITIYYGNVSDPYYIKQEYVLQDIYANPEYSEITLTGFLYIPEMYKQYIRVFNKDSDTDTTWKIVKKLCEEMKLGLFTNIDATDDSQVWIQDNCTNHDFLVNTIFPHCYTNTLDTEIIFFIDQYDYLNMIDVKKAYNNKEKEKTTLHPQYGTPLDKTHEVILTSKLYSDENYPFKITNWTANFSYGSTIDTLPNTIYHNQYSISELPFVIKTTAYNTDMNVIKNIYHYTPNMDNVHSNYNLLKHNRKYVDIKYNQGDEIVVKMAWPVMLLYPYMYTPLELYTQRVKVEYDNQQNESTWKELYESRPLNEGLLELRDELHSGDYIITSIKYESSMIDEQNIQFVTLKRLPLINPPIITVE